MRLVSVKELSQVYTLLVEQVEKLWAEGLQAGVLLSFALSITSTLRDHLGSNVVSGKKEATTGRF